jgi:hypothetical protein
VAGRSKKSRYEVAAAAIRRSRRTVPKRADSSSWLASAVRSFGAFAPERLSFAESVLSSSYGDTSALLLLQLGLPQDLDRVRLWMLNAQTATLRRLIGSSVVVGPATMPCRHERPLDGRQPTEREVQATATGGPATPQGGRWIRIASSRSNRHPRPSARSACASLAWRALCLLADAQMLPGWRTPPEGVIGPNFGGTLGRCRSMPGGGRQAMSPVCPGGWCFVWGAPVEGLDAGEALPSHCHAVRSLQPPLAARRARRGRAPPPRRRGRAGRRRPHRRRARPQARRGRRVRRWPGCRPTR